MTTDYRTLDEGDRVRLTGNGELHEFSVLHCASLADGDLVIEGARNSFRLKMGWTLEILERAKPELPTEPGYYEVSKYLEIPQVLVLHTNARWYVPGAAAPLDIEGYKDNTFTRLVPAASND